jgi:hypothetical protein
MYEKLLNLKNESGMTKGMMDLLKSAIDKSAVNRTEFLLINIEDLKGHLNPDFVEYAEEPNRVEIDV